jgi:GDP-L-fucose synthase
MIDLTQKRIVVTGASGFLGTYVIEGLRARGVPSANIFAPSVAECDLRVLAHCARAVDGMDIVVHLAALVGGIGANREHPGRFLYENAIMGMQLMEAARLAGTGKFLAVGTICEYPKITPVPFRESDIWNGPVDEVTGPYGLAKRMLLAQGHAYHQEYGFNAVHLLPTNLYGPRDNFDPRSSHVIPALIKKIFDAKREKRDEVEVWGSGKATREFLYVEDAAEGIVRALERYDEPAAVNLGTGVETAIADVVRMIAEAVGYRGAVRWNSREPEGQPRRALDVSRAEKMFGFRAKVELADGLRRTVEWYAATMHHAK